MTTGFIIINYNDSKTTIELLNNILNYGCINEIVVVDNNSKDDSLIQLKKYQSNRITILSSKLNNGYGAGINIGAKYLINKYGDCNLIVSNSDVIIKNESDLVTLLKDMKADCGMIAPIIKEREGISKGWICPSPYQDCVLNIPYIHRYLRDKLLNYNEDHYKNDVVEVNVVSGCFFILDSKSLKAIDFLDENIFLYYEENILYKKLEQIHKKVYLDSKVNVFHNHSVTIDKSMNKLNKYKELKKSQYYFHCVYNNANIVQRSLLKLSDKFTYLVLMIVYRLKS
ncbi:MAG: glycosyltransferase [Erysipelotrichaceae bacterium]